MSHTVAQGHVDPRFRKAVDAFEAGFREGRDVGAAVAVIIDGEFVIDVWGGHTNREHSLPWQQDTLCCMFSISKAISSICLLQAVSEGHLTIDTRIVDVWPEFASHNKANVTVTDLLSHRLGLVGFRQPVPKDVYYHWDDVCQRLADEIPWWTPGDKHGYHARTLGFLIGEVLKRITGKSVGQWLAERIALPSGLDLAIGLQDADLARCADMLPARVQLGHQKALPEPMQRMLLDMNNLQTPTGAAFQNPSMPPRYMNSTEFRQSQIPALNGHGTATAVARLMAYVPELLSSDVYHRAIQTHSYGPDEVLKSTTRFGLGFMLHDSESPIGIQPGSFGHSGAGGSLAFYDPDARLGFAFLMNQMQEGVVTGGTSAMHVARTVYECLEN